MPNANRTVYPDLKVFWGTMDITDDYMNLEWSSKVDLIEKSAGTESNKSYIGGRSDEDFTLDFATVGKNAVAAGGTVERFFYPRNTGTLIVAPYGTAAGNPKYEIPVMVESTTMPFKSYDLAMLKVKLKANGTWTSNFLISGSTY